MRFFIGDKESCAQRRFRAAAVGIVLFGLALRLLYVSVVKVDFPIRGDINQYVLYAWNLSHRGTFSTALPDAVEVEPSSYRGPGYPALLAATMLAAGHADLPLRPGPQGTTALGYETDRWMRLAIDIQVLLGTATIWLTILVARFWLRWRWALAAGLIVAVWPHLVAFTGVLLSETLFGFLLSLSFWMLCRAEREGGKPGMAIAGLAWGMTYLVNPVVAFFPLLAAGSIGRRSGWRVAGVLVAGFMLAPALWGLRNAISVHDPGALRRAEQNFVEGSWPYYHDAYNNRFNNPVAQRILADIQKETVELERSPSVGMESIFARLSHDPGLYLDWYLVYKPYLLWDWILRLGWGDIYFLPTQNSPFERIPILAATKKGLELLNPFVFGLAALAALGILGASLLGRRNIPFAPLALSALVVYLTAVHVALQAEPRYSVPYRPEEVLLAITALAVLGEWIVARIRKLPPDNAPWNSDSSRMPRRMLVG